MENSPLLKQLASSDPEARDAAIKSLRIFLTRAQPFTHAELLKLHKYLYYAVYMSDGPVAQQSLCKELASLVAPLPNSAASGSTLADDNVVPFLRAFWQTISREWTKLDRLRMDKYMLLVRLMLTGMFARLKKNKWAVTDVAEHMDVVTKGPLVPNEDAKVPRGITYHVIDCWLDALDNVSGEDLTDEKRRSGIPIDALLRPLRNLEQTAELKTVRKLAGDALSDDRLAEWGITNEDGDEENEWDGLEE